MTLTLELLQDKIISTRAAEVTELIFLIRANPIVESEEVRLRAEREFASGQNIYLTDASTFMGSAFMLMGEDGRRIFVEALGQVLDDYGLDFTDRHAWADILNHW